MNQTIKIAIAQLNPTIGDLVGNREKILEAAKQAEEAGARLMLTPELSLCGYPPRDLLLNQGFVSAMDSELQILAKQLPCNLAVLVGVATRNPQAEETGGKALCNSIVLLEAGQIQQTFHKRLLPTYDVFDEHRYFEPGKDSNYFILHPIPQTPQLENSDLVEENQPQPIKIGVTICEDLWNDEEFWGKRNYSINPLADLAALDVDLIVNLSGSPYTLHKHKLREAMLIHGATYYQTPIIYNNQVGGNDDLLFDGSSFAINRGGELACRGAAFASDLVITEFNLVSGDLDVTQIAPLPASEDEEIWQALVLGVKDYARKCGFTSALLGLSGGIDSSLVAAIAAEALGAENILGVLMPSPYSSTHSIDDAVKLVENLGINSEKIPIGEAMATYDTMLESLFAGTEFGVAEENLQSRIRGNLLMAIANKFGHLLLSTGNKSEMAVGYCTLYGDMNGGLAVIADLPKTRVYSLCNWLNREKEVIPSHVISKPPSAELKPGQMDQDSLPPYDILDDILQRIVHRHQSSAEIIEAGYDSQVVNKVIRLVHRAEFKRRQAPPALKITDRAFGTGWRMPIASRK